MKPVSHLLTALFMVLVLLMPNGTASPFRLAADPSVLQDHLAPSSGMKGSSESFQMLFVDDEQDLLDMLTDLVSVDLSFPHTIKPANTFEEAVSWLNANPNGSVLVADYDLSDLSGKTGVDVLLAAKARNFQGALILHSGSPVDEILAHLSRAGLEEDLKTGRIHFFQKPKSLIGIRARIQEHLTHLSRKTKQAPPKVLILDDDILLRRSTERKVKQRIPGVELVSVSDFSAAIQALTQNSFDFLILDFMIGGEKTGVDVLAHALENGFDGRTFFSSGNPEKEILENMSDDSRLSPSTLDSLNDRRSEGRIQIFKKPESVDQMIQEINTTWAILQARGSETNSISSGQASAPSA